MSLKGSSPLDGDFPLFGPRPNPQTQAGKVQWPARGGWRYCDPCGPGREEQGRGPSLCFLLPGLAASAPVPSQVGLCHHRAGRSLDFLNINVSINMYFYMVQKRNLNITIVTMTLRWGKLYRKKHPTGDTILFHCKNCSKKFANI